MIRPNVQKTTTNKHADRTMTHTKSHVDNTMTHQIYRGRRGRVRMVVGHITTYAISAYHH